MANEKVETKVGLLLLPQQLTESFYILASFHVHKSSSGISYDTYSLEARDLKANHTNLPKQAADLVMQFSENRIEDEKFAIKLRYTKQRAGVDYNTFLQNAMLRHLHDLMNMLKPFFVTSRWYHKVLQPDKKNYKTAPCSFSTYKSQLSFDIIKQNELLGVETNLVLNGATYLLSSFKRYQFLLESGNEYFLLSFKDYQTIEWLEKNVQQYQHSEEAFTEYVLTKLETDYTVNRNNHFTQNEVEALPVNRIFLSELNNAFLMLTPQWHYDGFLVEGAFAETFETKQNGIAYTIKRNKEAEEHLLKLIQDLHPNFPKQKNGYYYLSFADAQKKQWFLKAYHHLLSENIDIIGMDMLKHFKYSSFQAETTIVIKEQSESRVLLTMQTFFGKEEIPLKELQKILFAGQKAVLLKDGSLGVFGDEWLHQYTAIIKHGKIDGKEIEVARWLAITEERGNDNSPILQSTIKKDWWQKWVDWQTKDEPVYHVPSIVHATLRPYQQKGFEWLALLADVGAGGCLADDMGLGKTLQTICFLAHYIHHHPGTKNIIICPSSLIYNWQNELQKFAPSIKVLVYHGVNRKEEDLQNEALQIIITSYGTVRADNGQLFTTSYGVAVVDESHNIKNPSAQITKAITSLQANINIALSGTPVVNNTFDLYSQLNFALPGMFGNREFFKREYADAIDRYHDEEKIAALQKMTAPFILRRTKEQVAKDLPEKTESILWCTMNNKQRLVYDDINEQIKSNIFSDIKTKGLAKSKLAVLQGIMKLRQVCNTPLLLPVEEQQGSSDSIKTDMLMNELQNILGNHKAIVFSQFSSMLHLIAAECDKQGLKYFHFDGQTPPAKRAEMVAAFQEQGCDTHLFLISLKAGNTGLTLTAADYVFLFDPWWNTAIEQQAIDRTHRIGQTKNVFAYKIICKDTIEEKIIKLQERKQKLAEELVTEDDGFVKSLSEEDVAYLFG